MGFVREARRVRDESLPMGNRFHALGSCIQFAQPIGFNATWAYLQEKLECHWRDPRFLLPAIELLEAERNEQIRICTEYAGLRRSQKFGGLRVPPRDQVTPRDPARWHGDERVGARHFLESWSKHRRPFEPNLELHPQGGSVLRAVDDVLRDGTPSVEAADLQVALNWARRQIHVVGWPADREQFGIAWNSHRLLGQLHLVAHGATPVARPWNFLPE